MSALKAAAIAMIALGVLLGVVAIRFRPDASPARPGNEVSDDPRIVVAIEAVGAGDSMDAKRVGLRRVALVPDGAFTELDAVMGRAPTVALSRGEPVLAKHFEAEGALARMLEPGERAVAVKIDRVTGLGGFVQPGDRVDVLFFLKRDGREVDATEARTLLTDVRVLAFGKEVEARADAQPALDARTAVLAVSEADAPLLLLGDSAGRLRLALRHGGGALGGSGRSVAHRARLSELVTQAAAGSAETRPTIPVIRGVTVRRDARAP
jgi:pilus assembly protein CpaB